MFTKKGLITIAADKADEDQLMEIALSAGADDMENTGGLFEITCEPGSYDALKSALQENDIDTEVAEISMIPQNTVPISNEATARKIISMMDSFEEHDDVQNVYANFDIPDEILSRIS